MDPSFRRNCSHYPSQNVGGSSSSEEEDFNFSLSKFKFESRLDGMQDLVRCAKNSQREFLVQDLKFALLNNKNCESKLELFINPELVSKIHDYLLGVEHLGVNNIPLALHVEENYKKAKLLAKIKIPSQIDLIFLCGKQFDSKCNLQIIPIELIHMIFRSKYAAFLDFESFERAAEGKVYDTLASRMFREVPLLAVTHVHIQSEINPCVIN